MQEFDNINGLYSVCDSKSRELVRSMTTNIFDFVQYIEGYPNVDLNEADWSNALNEAIKAQHQTQVHRQQYSFLILEMENIS